MNKLAVIIGVAVAIYLAYFLVGKAFIVMESDDTSPFDTLDEMDEATRADFDAQVAAMANEEKIMDESRPIEPQLLAENDFVAEAHEVAGSAQLIEVDGKKIVRFEDFNTINGPELHIYMSAGLNNDDFVDLGKIKATKGNVNYELPADLDTKKYRYVMVWCQPFGVLFSYADLTQDI